MPVPNFTSTTKQFVLGTGCSSKRNKRLLNQFENSESEQQYHQNQTPSIELVIDQDLSRSMPHALNQKDQISYGSD